MSDLETEFLIEMKDQLNRQVRIIENRITDIENGMVGDDLLHGIAIADEAEQVLRKFNVPLDYHTMLTLIEERSGKRVYGKKPEASLLSVLHRDNRFFSLRPRSGVFGLTKNDDSI